MSKLATNNLEMIIRSDQQDLDRCERVGVTDGEKNIPNQSSKTMSKFEISEISKNQGHFCTFTATLLCKRNRAFVH